MIRISLILCLFTAVALGAEKLTVHYRDGKKQTLTVSSIDEGGFHGSYDAEAVRVLWKELTPRSAYDVRLALTPYDDGAARRKLAEFARERKLFPQAIEQLEIAFALGALNEAQFEETSAAVAAEEVAWLTGRIDTLLDSGAEPAECLEAIKRLKSRYPDHDANRRYDEHVDALVAKLAKAAHNEKAAAQQEKESRELARLRKAVEKLNEKKQREMDKALELIAASKEAIEKEQVSRVKRTLVDPGAERHLKRARKYLRRIARLDKEFRVVTKEALRKEYDDIAKLLMNAYLEVARIQMSQRNYKGSIEWVRKVLMYDPIHEEALEMVEEIRENRITFKISDITNARPRVTGG